VGETEHRLIWLATTGDSEAFSELVSLFESKVYRAAYALTGNEHDAADLTQETFLRAFKGIGAFRGRCPFFTWLYRILLNTFKTWLRARSRMPKTVPSGHQNRAPVEEAASSPSGSQLASDRETVDKVYRAISALPDEQRMAVVLHCLEDMSYREIAGAMRCSVGTVKSRIHAARLVLKREVLGESDSK